MMARYDELITLGPRGSQSHAELYARVVAIGELVDVLGRKETLDEPLIEKLLDAQLAASNELVSKKSATVGDAVQKLMLWAYEDPDLYRPEDELTLSQVAGLEALADLRRLILDTAEEEFCVFRSAA
ncbi:MAG: hypothetical protein V2I43_18140 [Parvularcula sp.]|jgi:hypothetical protein|nr:hypothetical protein [Parvularcula sp.]